ncbi:hypothetical protein ACVWZK_008456 [Bradyrhizobium sp. GM0.4]
MLDCDRKLEVLIAALGKRQTKPARKLSRPRVKTKQVNTPAFDVRTALYGVLGVDLTEIHGLAPSLALKLIGECGTDLRAWQTASTSLGSELAASRANPRTSLNHNQDDDRAAALPIRCQLL